MFFAGVLQAEHYHLPIISDDVYSEMVFEGNEYVSVAEVSSTVPIISVGGMAKRYMVPGTPRERNHSTRVFMK